MTKWGLAATIRAPADEILAFAAYHIDLGAHRLYLYLDAPDTAAFGALKAHPKIRVTRCDDAHWRRRGIPRPAKHQVRQCVNATHAYARRAEVDWLIHMDADEFLWPDAPVAALLSDLPADTLCGRIRPIEAVAGDGTLFKSFIPAGPERSDIVARLYPRFGAYVKGGFLSHVAGKLFARTGLDPLEFRIHNIFRDGVMNPGQTELTAIALCHCHAKSWEDWIAAFRYRLAKGAYRADLPAARPREQGGLGLHALLTRLETEEGEPGLRAFYDEICANSPAVRAALRAEGLLRICDLQLEAKRRKHFGSAG